MLESNVQKLWVVETRCWVKGELPFAVVGRRSAIMARDTEIRHLRCSQRRSKIRFIRFLQRTKGTARNFLTLFRHFSKGDAVLAVTNPLEAPIWIAFIALFRGGTYQYFWIAEHGASTDGIDSVRVTDDMVGRQYFRRWALKHVAGLIVASSDLVALAADRTDGLDTPVHLVPR